MRNLTVLVLLLALGCGPTTEKGGDNVIVVNADPNNVSTNGMPNAAPNNQMISERDRAIVDGFTAPSDAHLQAETAISLTLQSAVLASVAANGGEQLVTTGTLTQSGQQFSYAAGPADKLVIKWSDGPPTDIYIQQLDGDFQAASLEAFLGANHAVGARLVREGFVDYEVGSAKSGGSRQGGIQGTIIEDGVAYEVDLQEVGTTQSDVGTSIDYTSESTMTGTITAPGLSLIAEETYYYRHVAVDNSIENRSRTANSRWTYNGNEYAVNGGLVRTAFKNSYPDEFDYWRIEGSITENGASVGEFRYEEDQFKIDIFVLLASGERIELESYTKRQ